MTESLTNNDNEAFDDEAACEISAVKNGLTSLSDVSTLCSHW